MSILCKEMKDPIVFCAPVLYRFNSLFSPTTFALLQQVLFEIEKQNTQREEFEMLFKSENSQGPAQFVCMFSLWLVYI